MLRDCWGNFICGVTGPSLTSLVIVISLNLIVFFSLSLLITPAFMMGDGHHYLMQDPWDRNVSSTAKILSIRKSETPDIVVLGDSLTVHCVAGEERLARMVTSKMGKAPSAVFDLSVPGQTSWEMAAIVEKLPPQFDGVLIIGIGPGLLSYGVEELKDIVANPRLGFLSKALEQEAGFSGLSGPSRTGIYFIDNWRFLSARRYFIARNLFVTGAQPTGDIFDDVNKPESPDRQNFIEQEIDDLPWLMQEYELNKNINFDVIQRIVVNLRKRSNASFILMEAPYNPAWNNVHGAERFFKKVHSELKTFAAKHEMSFLSATMQAALLPADFMDYEGHLDNREAIERCSEAIATQVVKVMTKKEMVSQRDGLVKNLS